MTTEPDELLIVAACNCTLSEARNDYPPCPDCGACEDCCKCACIVCGAALHAMDDCLACLEAADTGDDVDHTQDVLGDLCEQVRELS